MKKIFLVLVLISLIFVPSVFADRDTATVTTYNSSQLIKRGDAKIYSITFKATANGGNFIILNALTDTTSPAGSLTDIKAEGGEVTALGSQFQNFSDKPLEFSTGLYLIITDGYVILRYE